MASQLLDTLGRELESLDKEYANDFAGQSRRTRDDDQMKRLVERARKVVASIDQIPAAARGPDLTALRDAAATNLATYEGELKAIAQAKAAGPGFEQFAGEATRANFVFARYTRHYAGQNRQTRDLALLGEMVADLKQIDKRMTSLLADTKGKELESDREIVRSNLAMYQKEIEAIEKAQREGTAEDQASVLATVANEQFQAYQTHFAGKSRISRRPALLVRIVDTLKKTKARMEALKAEGVTTEWNDKNIGIVTERLGVYEGELTEIRKVRQGVAMTQIMAELGGAANQVFEEYRAAFAGKNRAQVDRALLGQLCDRLFELLRQMDELALAEASEMNDRNIEVVVDQLSLFESEFDQVSQAQKNAAPAATA